MSAFCVYGMTSLIAKVRAEKRHMPKDFEGTREEFLLMQTEEILKKSTVCQASPAFDAPQFCNDWIAADESLPPENHVPWPEERRQGGGTYQQAHKAADYWLGAL